MKPYVFRTTIQAFGGGWRVTCGDDSGPTVSLVGDDRDATYERARQLFSATPEPIDAILQAAPWHGKAATA